MFELRYARHLSAPEIGLDGQLRLLGARVLLVGAGGLGSASALYLAAAGIGTLGLVDGDVVEESNLHRQVIHTTACAGMAKVDSAERSIAALNPDVRVIKYHTSLDDSNAADILDGYDVIVDAVDNFATRDLINTAAMALGRPVVSAALCEFDGWVSVFSPPAGPCYRCLNRVPPPVESPSSCAGPGVLGVLPGVLGSLQAAEVVKLVLRRGRALVGRLVVYDALEATFTELRIERDPQCPACAAATAGRPGLRVPATPASRCP